MDILSAIKNATESGKITVLGIGISNIPLIDFLLKRGAKLSARDMKDREALGEIAAELEEKGVELVLGKGYLDNITEDVIFRSPGIRPDVAGIKEAVAHGALLTSEMELFFEMTKANIIGITGSDGKTTTTTLTYKLLSEQFEREGKGRRVFVGGNIGAPLLPLVDEMTENDVAVVELSSFQLQTMTRSPERAAITNITPNHLNWHTDMEEYAEAKKNICKNAGNVYLTLNAENDRTAEIAKKAERAVTVFSSKRSAAELSLEFDCPVICEEEGYICFAHEGEIMPILRTSNIKLPGRHNVENYMTAISLTRGMVSPDVIEHVARTFGGVEHRLEFVRELDGVKYYNSSIDSSPTRTAAALSSFKDKVVVICGGYDKNIPFEPLADTLISHARVAVLTGATREKIKSALLAHKDLEESGLEIVERADFTEAVIAARNAAKRGEAVVLSPACASFDAFKNFEVRGNCFKDTVNSFQGENNG